MAALAAQMAATSVACGAILKSSLLPQHRERLSTPRLALPVLKKRQLACRAKQSAAVEEDDGPTDEDMMNVGLDDVFALIEKASEANPGVDNLPTAATSSNAKYTPFTRAYKMWWRTFPKSVDARTKLYGPARPLWKGPNTQPSDVPSYLKGQYPGDYGCDILGLCKDKDKYATLRAQELLNARWAMLGVVGCLYPELMGARGAGFEPVFSDAGIDYLGVPTLIDAHSIVAIVAVQAVLLGGAELLRAKGAPDTNSLYPGGAFDPLGLASDAESFAELQVKEIKNGRLAMLAMAGLFAQGALTGESPLKNLADFIHQS
eukprot:jgi/Mesen1/9031/ME000565S08345